MGPLTYLAMFGWPPFVIYLFRWLPYGWAFPISFVMGFLFLPQAVFPIPGFPAYSRMIATAIGVVTATLLFDVKRFQTIRLSWMDIPMIIWCICPFVTSITNDLGWYDGFRAASDQTGGWGVPYLLGRLYLQRLESFRKLAIVIFLGAVSYIPFCLYEFKAGPAVHQMVYGFSVAPFIGAMRPIGYRPTVFLGSGLMTGIWMLMSLFLGVWLWKTGVLRKFWGIHIKWLIGAIGFAFILSQSMSALISTVMGLIMLFVGKWTRTSFLLLIFIVAMPAYLYFPSTGNMDIDGVISVVERTMGPNRAFSLETRFRAEEVLVVKARERMMFGWGGWGRNRVQDLLGKDIAVTDSQWVLAYGTTGLIGLVSFTVWLLLPTVVFIIYFPAYLWHDRRLAPVATMAMILPFYMLDCILNAMPNAIIVIINGGITTLLLKRAETSNRERGIDLLVAEQYLSQAQQQPSRLLVGDQIKE